MGELGAVRRVMDGCFGEAGEAERAEWLEWTVRNYVALERLHQPPYGEYAVEVRDTGEVIGAVGIVPSMGPFGVLPGFRERGWGDPGGRFTPEVGLFWAVVPEQRRRGYAVEAARGVIGFAFGEMQLARVVATTEFDNEASIGVMRKLGMRIERNERGEPGWFQVVGVVSSGGIAI